MIDHPKYMKKESLKIEEDKSDRYNNVNHNNDNSDEDCLKIIKNPKFSFLNSSISLWLERWFWSSNAKDILRHRGPVWQWKTNSKSTRCVQYWYSLLIMLIYNEILAWVMMDSQVYINAENISMNTLACWVESSDTWMKINHYYKTGQCWPIKFNLIKQTISGKIKLNLLGTFSLSHIFAYAVKVKTLVNFDNSQVTNAQRTQVNTSEIIRLLNISKNSYYQTIKNPQDNNLKFKQWLAGLIDGKGKFSWVKSKGWLSLEIVMDLRDERVLQTVKNIYGGSIKLRTSAQSLKYRLHHKKGTMRLINDVNGQIRNPNVFTQLNNICIKYNISLILQPEPLTYNNGWFSGFFDAAGDWTVQFDYKSPKLVVSVIHRNYHLLYYYKEIFGGNIKLDRNEQYIWLIDSKNQVLSFLEYVKIYSLCTERHKRSYLITKFYKLLDLNTHYSNSSLLKESMVQLLSEI